MSTTTLKVDWDDDTINAVRVACLAAAEVYESLGSLPGFWNLNDAVRLRTAAEDIKGYVESCELVKQSQLVGDLSIALRSMSREVPGGQGHV